MKGMLSVASLSIGLFLLAGCATGYEKQGSFPLSGGFKDEEVAPDVYRIKFQGNGYTSIDRARLCVMYRCAELTLEKGCHYYAELTAEQIRSSNPSLVVPLAVSGGGSVSPGGAAFGVPSSPNVGTFIRIFKGAKPTDFPNAKSAEEVLAEIKPVLFPNK
jgi:hypothetical protein